LSQPQPHLSVFYTSRQAEQITKASLTFHKKGAILY